MNGRTTQRYATIIPMKELASPTLQLNPFPILDDLRRTSPIRYDEDRACWDVFSYEDARNVLLNHRVFSSRRGMDVRGDSMLVMDQPKHTQMRALVNKAFTPKSIEDLAPRIANIVDDLLDQVADGTEMNVVHDLAYPLPVIVIAELLGVPSEDRALFKKWSDILVKAPENNTDEAFAQVVAERGIARTTLNDYFRDILKQRRANPQDDLISALLQAQIDGQKLTEQELLGFCLLLLVAGNETTTNLIANAVRYLTEDMAVQERWRNTPTLTNTAIEEVLRYYPPIVAIGRIASEDTEIRGQRIAAGSQVVSWVAAANRDEAQFPDADRFVPDRTPNRHLGFGLGIHFCLGAPLARLEAQIALPKILERLGTLTFDEGTPLVPIQSTFVFGVKEYPIRFKR
ncbi:cytochrome P450 [Alicyclobacillus fastidiosus]|uniref:Cytochrome P450 n=1 Tax=Alicyclobacillus fastidiosus TaxID=392011 RepID=A0ABY6ZI95_9BACL|nr:cytochrome P450 [Alicyclobacillus fastidiosus]WAH42541.1 cytochrome P450 [Alicyclobacillus fastidiosus]GMA64388.1 putative cytochrome P450 YjiB [Alicyclobacillus fastidiosus]